MKNILNEKPTCSLNGRLLESVKFVKNEDIKDKNILDIGFGFGWCELNFLNRGVKKVIGVEVSDESIAKAKSAIKDKRVEFFKIKNTSSLPFRNKSFHTVVIWAVLEHISQNTENSLFQEIHRLLKDDGIVYLSTPFNSICSKFSDPAWWIKGHRHYSIEQFRKFASESSFQMVDYQIKGKFWSSFSIFNMYFSKWILRRKPILQQYFLQRENKEYKNNNGYNTIFIKFKKINNKIK